MYQMKSMMSKGLPKKIGIPGVKHVILVSSAKGGVGKSSTTINLAHSFKQHNSNLSIGILDADVYGPSIPKMINLDNTGDKPELNKQNLMIPLNNHGIKCMSIGFLMSKTDGSQDAIIWRGLMVMQAIQTLLRKVVWGPLDILLIDMPPGTGDTSLSIIQNIPVSGVLIISTPQKISLIDARKSIVMYQKTGLKIFGLIQNMSYLICNKCHEKHMIYGDSDGMQQLSSEMNLDILSDIPFDSNIMSSNDEGSNYILTHPESDVTKSFKSLVFKLMERLTQPLDG